MYIVDVQLLCCGNQYTTTSSTSTTTTGSATTTIAIPTTTEAPSKTSTTPAPPVEPPSKVVGVRVTSSEINALPTLTVMWQALSEGAVTYTVKYSTQPAEVNTPPEEAMEMTGINGTSTILTALKKGTTYYIWVVAESEGGEGPHSDRTSGVTYDSELYSTNNASACKWQGKTLKM